MQDDHKSMIDNLYTAVHIGDLQEVKKITNRLTSSSLSYPKYNLLCISLLHKHMDIARFFVNDSREIAGNSKQNYRGNSPLHLAVLHGDSSLVKLMLINGVLHTSRNIDGLMPLHLIVYRNPAISGNLQSFEEFDEESSKIIDVLLEFGVNINAMVNSLTQFGYTCLHLAAECGNERIIPILLKKHCNFNAKTEIGFSPLHLAVINGNNNIINLLLKNGAPLYPRDNRGKTPLCWSIKVEKFDIMESILNYQVLPSEKNSMYFNTLQNDTSSLLTAVKMDNPSIVESLLKKGVNANARRKDGTSALHIAAETGADDIVKLLLDHGADVTAIGCSGKSVLYCAVEREWIEIVQILLNCVPEINCVLATPSFEGVTPLQLAVSKGCEDIVKLLLQKGHSAVINPQSGEYPLHTAILKNRVKILKLLLENEVDVNVTDMYGQTALHIAAYQGTLEMVQVLCRVYSKQEKKWKEGYGALYIAALTGRMDVVKLLLEEGADLNARANHCLTPLCAAAENGHVDIVKFLLANGVDVNETLNDGRNALICGVQRGFFQVTECLLQSGADVNFKVNGDSSLHFAAAEGNLAITKLLLSNGANVNAKNLSGATPLFIAIQRNLNHIVQYLVQNGADVNIADQDSIIKSFNFTSDCIYDLGSHRGLRPLIVAVDNCNFEIVRILLESGTPANIPNERVSPLHLASANGRLEIVKELIKFGANINFICEQNYTAFSHTITNGEAETFMYLLSKGVQFDKNSRNSELHIALNSIKKDEKIVKMLLDHGICARATNCNNETALHCAISFGNVQEEHKLFRLLLDYGADINARDENENTPIHIAAREGDLVAAEVFLEYEADLNVVNSEGKTPLKYLVDVIGSALILYMSICNLETYKYPAIAKLVVRAIALRESTGRFVNDMNLELVKNEKINCFYKRCKQELSRMKRRKIYKEVTLYDILTMNDTRLATYMGNKSLKLNLMSICTEKKFNCYNTMFTYRIKMALERRQLIDTSEDVFKSILKFNFPTYIVHEIFSYLSPVDFKTMARVFQRPE